MEQAPGAGSVCVVQARRDADQARAGGLLDPVTGLYNRQGLARRARELGSQAFREHGPLACIVLALDVEPPGGVNRSEEHTSELQSRLHLVCRLLLEKKKNKTKTLILTK